MEHGDQRLPQHIWNRIALDASGCWIWTGTINDSGYGVVSLYGKSSSAHRLFYKTLVGPIETGLDLDHLCRVRPCCNPAHLEPVTRAENIRRGQTGQWQAAKTHCPAGHEYNDENTYRYTRRDGTHERQCKPCIRLRQNKTTTMAVVIGIGGPYV